MRDSRAIDEAVLSEVAAAFAFGDVRGPAEYVDSGVSGAVFKVRTGAGDRGLKRLFQEPDEAQLEIEIRLKDAARTVGIATPRPVRTADGRPVAMVANRFWLASEWAEVARDEASLLRPDRLRQVGDILARLHGMRLAAPHDVTPWLTTPPRPREWEELRSAVGATDVAWGAAFIELYPELLRLSEFASSMAPAPAVLSHCDLGPANVGVAGENLVVFDWERAGAIPPVQELGYVLVQWADHGTANEIVPHIVAGYRAGSSGHVVIDLDSFTCAANGFLNFLRAGVLNMNAGIVGRLLEKPVTVESLQALADLARGRFPGPYGSSSS